MVKDTLWNFENNFDCPNRVVWKVLARVNVRPEMETFYVTTDLQLWEPFPAKLLRINILEIDPNAQAPRFASGNFRNMFELSDLDCKSLKIKSDHFTEDMWKKTNHFKYSPHWCIPGHFFRIFKITVSNFEKISIPPSMSEREYREMAF